MNKELKIKISMLTLLKLGSNQLWRLMKEKGQYPACEELNYPWTCYEFDDDEIWAVLEAPPTIPRKIPRLIVPSCSPTDYDDDDDDDRRYY